MIKSDDSASRNIWAYGILVYATFVLLYPVVFSKQGSFFIVGDNLHQGYPFMHKLASSLHKGYLPLWDANTYGGRDFTGEMQSGIFYPLNVLWCLLFGSIKGIDVYYIDLLVVLHYFICLIGMYKLSRVFQMPSTAAIGAALTFSFSGVLCARSGCETCIFYGLCLMPWALYFLSKYYWEQSHKKYLVFTGLIAGLQILAGHIQPFFHTFLISVLFILFYEYRNRKSWKTLFFSVIINAAIILVFAIILALPQVYYAAEYLSRSYREVGKAVYVDPLQKVPLYVYLYWYILKPSDFENFLGQKSAVLDDFNYLYMGILPFSLFIIFLIKSRFLKMISEHVYLTRLLVIILIFGILSVLGYLTFFPYILHAIPFVSGIRELSRFTILISFTDALFVGLALTYLEQLRAQLFQPASKLTIYVLSALTLNALYWIFFQRGDISLDVSIPYLLAFIFFLVLSTGKLNAYVRLLAIALILVDLYMNPVNFQWTQAKFYPSNFYGRNRVINFLETTYGKYRVTFNMIDHSLTKRNLGDVYNIQTKWGYDATVNKIYYQFLNHDPKPERDTLSDPEIDDLLNIRYVMTDQILDSNYIFRDSTADFNLYERKNYYPRCYWKHQLGEPGRAIEAENEAVIRQLSYSDVDQKWVIQCSSPDTLIFSENSYPGWRCYDNQREVKMIPVSIKNHPPLFRCVALNKGSHIVEFRYRKVFYWF